MNVPNLRTGFVRAIASAACCGLLLLSTAGASLARTGRVYQQASTVNVVAAENFYGNIVQQLGGSHVSVTSIISDPNSDPHEYESDAGDAEAINVGDLAGKSEGDNPHLWYNVPYVIQLAGVITTDLEQIDSGNKSDYDAANAKFLSSLGLLQDTISTIKAQYAGTRVAMTEPVIGYMLTLCGLSADDGEFQHAIGEGTDPSPSSVAALESLISKQQIAVLLYNSQTISPITDQVREIAVKAGVPVVPVTETQPPTEPTYQQWMVDQLNAIQQALNSGIGS